MNKTNMVIACIYENISELYRISWTDNQSTNLLLTGIFGKEVLILKLLLFLSIYQKDRKRRMLLSKILVFFLPRELC